MTNQVFESTILLFMMRETAGTTVACGIMGPSLERMCLLCPFPLMRCRIPPHRGQILVQDSDLIVCLCKTPS